MELQIHSRLFCHRQLRFGHQSKDTQKSERKDKGKTQVFQVWLPQTVSYILSKDKECRAQRQGEKLALTFDQNKQILFLLKME